jgi:hypothetical protein
LHKLADQQSKTNKKGQSKTKKSQSCVKIVKLPIRKLLVFFFARQGPQKSILCDVYFITLNDIDLLIYAN